jgi:hypothetical protein
MPIAAVPNNGRKDSAKKYFGKMKYLLVNNINNK